MTDASDATPAAPPPPAPEADEAESYIDFRKTGGIHIVLDGEKKRLRAPRMRDYRKLYELWREEAEELEASTEELQAFMTEVMGKGDERTARGEPAITPEEHKRDRELGRKVRVATEDASLRWWSATIAALGVDPKDRDVDVDDLPVFLTTAESVNEALTHWRSVPSRSGAR